MFVPIQVLVLSAMRFRILELGQAGLMKLVSLKTCLVIPLGKVLVSIAFCMICMWCVTCMILK